MAIPTVTPTQPPLAARVNEGYILLSDYQAELQRLKAAEVQSGIPLTDEERSKKVMEELIGQELLAQEAIKNGFILEEPGLEEKIQRLKDQAGGDDALSVWINNNGYDEESLKRALWKATAAAFERDRILAALPNTVEQVHARQILVFSQESADNLHTQLDAGADFATLAKQVDPLTGGDLGWFPKGYLTQPDLEAAAFSLDPGTYSDVIQTPIGFHILQVIEKDTARKLDPDAGQVLQRVALKNWIQEAVKNSTIEILYP